MTELLQIGDTVVQVHNAIIWLVWAVVILGFAKAIS